MNTENRLNEHSAEGDSTTTSTDQFPSPRPQLDLMSVINACDLDDQPRMMRLPSGKSILMNQDLTTLTKKAEHNEYNFDGPFLNEEYFGSDSQIVVIHEDPREDCADEDDEEPDCLSVRSRTVSQGSHLSDSTVSGCDDVQFYTSRQDSLDSEIYYESSLKKGKSNTSTYSKTSLNNTSFWRERTEIDEDIEPNTFNCFTGIKHALVNIFRPLFKKSGSTPNVSFPRPSERFPENVDVV